MNVLPLMVITLLVMAIAYRYYSVFLAAKVVVLNDKRKTPAHLHKDGQNYHPTNKWVLFGHHFAAIAGAGPLIGPVLAAQFGYVPSFTWLLAGVCLGGAVHDFMILAASIRRKGKSLVEIIRHEISPLAAITGAVAIFIIVILALAGLGMAVVNALKDSYWGTFSIFMTIPIAFLVGVWMRKGPKAIGPASAVGVALVFLAVVFGNRIGGSPLASFFTLSKDGVIWALALYGFLASILPVWLLLTPRDYLSSYMKLGTIFLLVLGILFVNPHLQMPAFDHINGGGPIIKGPLFPFVFITIACGAISGFHALVSSGTTPKMLDKESDARMIGYGAMLMEGLVGIVALLSTCALFPADYYAINLTPEKFQALGIVPVHLGQLSAAVGENVAGRPGGAVSLALGFAQIFSGFPGLESLMSYFYHFMIMFEALFILTTIDAGTRVARFLLQEFLGHAWRPFENPNWIPGTLLSTMVVVAFWAYLIFTGSVGTIWPMFGTANQLLASIALCAATSAILNTGKARYALTTFLPMLFVAVTTLWACFENISLTFWPMTQNPATAFNGTLNILFTIIIMACAVVVLWESFSRWYQILVLGKHPKAVKNASHKGHELPEYGCC